MFKHILIPTDGSALSTDTARRAISFAKEAGAEVTFYFAKPDYPISFYGEGALIDPTTPERFAELAEQQAQEVLSAVSELAQNEGVTCSKVSTVCDVPFEGIIAAANSCQADLIFMASHGRKGIGALLLGSETHKVLTHSKIPVLVYR